MAPYPGPQSECSLLCRAGEGFEEPRLEGAPGSARGAPAPRYLTWASGVHSPCHTLIPSKSKAAADQPFTGKQVRNRERKSGFGLMETLLLYLDSLWTGTAIVEKMNEDFSALSLLYYRPSG